MNLQTRIMVIDSRSDFRRCIRQLLDRNGDIEVIGEAEDGISAFNHIRKIKPDMVVINILMPANDDIDLIQQIVKFMPHIKVIVFTSYFGRDFVENIFNAGAYAYLLKESLRNELLSAIHKVRQNSIYISRTVVKKYCNIP